MPAYGAALDVIWEPHVDSAASLLLVTHVPLRAGPRGLQLDNQTAAGVSHWCRHFDRVTYIGVAEDPAYAGASSLAWVDTDQGLLGEKATLVALPRAYRIAPMAREYRAVRARLAQEIARHRHLCYTIGGLVGDWPALAGIESIRQKRRYAAWLDRVEPSIIRNKAAGASLRYRLLAEMAIPIMERYTRHILRHSAIALLRGGDTFEHYARWASDPHCIHNTHTHASDQIAADVLAAKQARALSGAPLNIVYVGRANAMKGPEDWFQVLERLHGAGVPFRATWVGDGPDLAKMRERVAGSVLAGLVDLPGFEGRRDVLLQALRDADLLLFCHKTAESARSLVEALVCGCPIVGYGTAYPRGLVETHGGGAFVPKDDVPGLAARVEALHRDRPALAALIGAAAASGTLYDEESVYAHRAGLMRLA